MAACRRVFICGRPRLMPGRPTTGTVRQSCRGCVRPRQRRTVNRNGTDKGRTRARRKFGLAVQLGQERDGAIGRQVEAAAVGAGLPGGGTKRAAVETVRHRDGGRAGTQRRRVDMHGRHAIEAGDAKAGLPAAPSFLGDAEQHRRRAARAAGVVARIDQDPGCVGRGAAESRRRLFHRRVPPARHSRGQPRRAAPRRRKRFVDNVA